MSDLLRHGAACGLAGALRCVPSALHDQLLPLFYTTGAQLKQDLDVGSAPAWRGKTAIFNHPFQLRQHADDAVGVHLPALVTLQLVCGKQVQRFADALQQSSSVSWLFLALPDPSEYAYLRFRNPKYNHPIHLDQAQHLQNPDAFFTKDGERLRDWNPKLHKGWSHAVVTPAKVADWEVWYACDAIGQILRAAPASVQVVTIASVYDIAPGSKARDEEPDAAVWEQRFARLPELHVVRVKPQYRCWQPLDSTVFDDAHPHFRLDASSPVATIWGDCGAAASTLVSKDQLGALAKLMCAFMASPPGELRVDTLGSDSMLLGQVPLDRPQWLLDPYGEQAENASVDSQTLVNGKDWHDLEE